jgi:hypothetical protein
LAGKAKELSLKHGLRDEAQLIELEEMRVLGLNFINIVDEITSRGRFKEWWQKDKL